jgi:hypothetical protein
MINDPFASKTKNLLAGSGSQLPFFAVVFSVVLTVFVSVKKRYFYLDFHGNA